MLESRVKHKVLKELSGSVRWECSLKNSCDPKCCCSFPPHSLPDSLSSPSALYFTPQYNAVFDKDTFPTTMVIPSLNTDTYKTTVTTSNGRTLVPH